MEAKDVKKYNKAVKDIALKEKTIARQWLNFSQTEAYKDLMDYGHSTSDILTTYAKEMVMPSPINGEEQIVIDGEKSLSLLQNARGCDIILSYVEQYVASSTNNRIQ